MRALLRLALLTAALALPLAPAAAQLRVVATTPDLKSLTDVVGGPLVSVVALVPPGSDPEAFEPRTGDLARIKGAEIVVRVGLGYDHWLDRLLAQNGDPRLARGEERHVDASLGIPLLEVQGRSVEVQAGHAHGLANPHYWLDPLNAETITALIAEALAASLPDQRATIVENRARFLASLQERVRLWEARLAPYRGARLVAYHNSWPYLARRFRLDIVDVIEPKEGVAPSPARLARLVAKMKSEKVRAVLLEPYEPREPADFLAERTGAAVAVLAPSVGSAPGTGDFLALFEHDVDVLARALAGAGG